MVRAGIMLDGHTLLPAFIKGCMSFVKNTDDISVHYVCLFRSPFRPDFILIDYSACPTRDNFSKMRIYGLCIGQRHH